MRELADTGGLAGAVNTDHENHERLFAGLDIQRLFTGLQDLLHVIVQGHLQGIDAAERLARQPGLHVIDDFTGGLDADVGAEQAGFEFIQGVAVNGFFTQEEVSHAVAEAAPGFGQPAGEAVRN